MLRGPLCVGLLGHSYRREGAKKGMRPKLPADTRRSSTTFTCLREKERKALDAAAQETGRSRSAILRDALRMYLERWQHEKAGAK